MSLKKIALGVSLISALSACGQSTEPPSEPGISLTSDQVKLLNADRTLADKRVAVVGYPLICSVGLGYRAGQVVKVEVHPQPDCRTPVLADANITLAGESSAKPGFGATGVRPRNRVLVAEKFTNETLTFLTDDYKVIPVHTPVRVAGLVTYPYGKSNSPLLESVSLHAVNAPLP